MKKMTPTLTPEHDTQAAADAAGRHGLIWTVVGRIEALFRSSGRYHPELHYMRGPGPKWHQSHDRTDDNVAGEAQKRR